MSVKQMVLSYLGYSSMGTGSIVLNGTTPENIVGQTIAAVEKTRVEASWLYDVFPSLVDSGALVVKDGHMFVCGVAITDLLTIVIAIVSFGFLILKGISDLSLNRLNIKVAELQLQKEEIAKRPTRRKK